MTSRTDWTTTTRPRTSTLQVGLRWFCRTPSNPSVRSCCDCGSYGFQEGHTTQSRPAKAFQSKSQQVTIRVGWPDPKPQLCAEVCSLSQLVAFVARDSYCFIPRAAFSPRSRQPSASKLLKQQSVSEKFAVAFKVRLPAMARADT